MDGPIEPAELLQAEWPVHLMEEILNRLLGELHICFLKILTPPSSHSPLPYPIPLPLPPPPQKAVLSWMHAE